MGIPVYPTQPTPPTHPHRDLGIVLLILGIVLLIGGIAAASYCSLSLLGVCIDYPYAGAGYALAIIGAILLVLGIVLMVITGPPSAPPVMYATQQPTYPGQQPLYVQGTTFYSARPPPGSDTGLHCPVCGAGNFQGSARCWLCGRALSSPTAPVASGPPVSPTSPPSSSDRFCPSCGGGNARSAAFCQKCGKPLPPPP